MTYTLHRLAERDLDSAFQFYRRNGSGKVALRFLAEFERVAELVERNPDIGTPSNEERRTYPFHKYPYSLIYKPTAIGIRILVVRHHRRAPTYGRERN